MSKYKDLRPCEYDVYCNTGEEGRSRYTTLVETICGKFHRFNLDMDEGSSCNCAIVELEDGSIENIPAFSAGIGFEKRNFRFTDHEQKQELQEKEEVTYKLGNKFRYTGDATVQKKEEPKQEPQEEVTYKLGDRFKYTGSTVYWVREYQNSREFFLVSVSDDVGLVCCETGRFIGKAIDPLDCERITAEEFDEICGNHVGEFEFIKSFGDEEK